MKVSKAVEVLKDHGVPEEHVVLINLFCTPAAAKRIVQKFPHMKVLTTEIHEVNKQNVNKC